MGLTMTLLDVCNAMRDEGMRCTPTSVARGIESGLYPFGVITHRGETGRRTVLIFRANFEKWLNGLKGE